MIDGSCPKPVFMVDWLIVGRCTFSGLYFMYIQTEHKCNKNSMESQWPSLLLHIYFEFVEHGNRHKDFCLSNKAFCSGYEYACSFF
jgi:hypothetical protein